MHKIKICIIEYECMTLKKYFFYNVFYFNKQFCRVTDVQIDYEQHSAFNIIAQKKILKVKNPYQCVKSNFCLRELERCENI